MKEEEILEIDMDNEVAFKVMQALASKTRCKILKILNKKPLYIIKLAEEIDQTEANTSAQVKILEKVQLIFPTYEAGKHGVRKICEPKYSTVILKLT